MNEALLRILETGMAGLLTAFIVFLRVGGAMAVLPAFGEQTVPPRV